MKNNLIFAAWLFSLGLPLKTLACATCMAGDPTLNTMGMEKNFPGRLRLSLEAAMRGEDIGMAGINLRTVKEDRLTLGISYALDENWVFGAHLPWLRKELENVNLARQKQSALGDLSLSVKNTRYRDENQRHTAGWMANLRLPTGQEYTQDNGQPLDIDVQPGAGNWALGAGGWYAHFNYPWFVYASANLHYPMGTGYADFEEGRALLTSVLLQYAPNYHFALQLGFDTRWSEKHHYAGVADNDSGGFIGFISPGLSVTLADDLLVNATVQIPLWDQLHGQHEEDPVLRLSVTYDWD